MAFDATKTGWTFNGTDSDGNAQVTFDCDGVKQTLGSCPTDSAESLKAYCDDYAVAYIAGKQIEQPKDTPSDDVQALVNKPQTNSKQLVDEV